MKLYLDIISIFLVARYYKYKTLNPDISQAVVLHLK